jgi:hypothetical protein
VLFLLSAPVLLYVAFCAVARLGYRVLLYPAPDDSAPIVPAGATMLTLRASDGAPVHALQFPPRDDHARTVVLFHGNGETIANGLDLAEDLVHRGFGVVLVEYRGYGISRDAPRPSEAGLYADASAVLDTLATQGIPPARIALIGISLGTGVASEMARRGRGVTLILVSPFTSITDMVRRVAPFLPARLIPDRFDTLGRARDILLPTLVVHGDADEVVPFAMGQAVAGAIPGATLHVIHGGHHNDLFAFWRREILDAIATHLGHGLQ